MINNSPRLEPAVCSATSNTATVRCSSPSSTASDPAEAAASLSLREGKREALRFYFDHGRVHVGDLAKITEDAFAAWVRDRSAGLDAIMLAPTRELVAELNRRARDHRLGNVPVGREAVSYTHLTLPTILRV